MKITQIAICTLFCFSYIYSENSTNIYVEEFNAFKNSPDYELIFNEDSNPALKMIQRDIENCKELTFLQRIVRSAFLNLGTIVVTEKTMPQLYVYIDTMCKQSGIKTPTILLTTEKGFFNAAAQKLLMSTGAIVIGQKLLLETSAQELEAVVAHEIGHIKHNHINKILALNGTVWLTSEIAAGYLFLKYLAPNLIAHSTSLADFQDKLTAAIVAKEALIILAILTLPSLIINKRFEKEADEFAYKTMNKGEGLIEFCEHLQKKEAQEDNDFVDTRNILTSSKPELATYSYAGLTTSYYLAKLGHTIDKAYSWFYHNTPFGAHPSPEARIKAAQDYLDSQEVIELRLKK